MMHKKNSYISFSLFTLCSRKPSLKDKVFPSPSKAPVAKGKAQSPEEGAEASPSKVAKSLSFNEKNRGPKHSFKVRGSASRQNSEGERTPQSRIIRLEEHYQYHYLFVKR